MFRHSSGGTTFSAILVAVFLLVIFTTGVIISYKLSGGSAAKIISEQKAQIEFLTKQLSNWKTEFKTSSCRIIESDHKDGTIPIQFTIFDINGPTLKPIWKGHLLLDTSYVSLEYKVIQFTNEKIDQEGKFCLYMITSVNGIPVQDNPEKRYEELLKKYNKNFVDSLMEILRNAEKYTDDGNLLRMGIRCKSVISMTYEIRKESVYVNSISANGAMFHDEFFM
jgi:hypothetical protein